MNRRVMVSSVMAVALVALAITGIGTLSAQQTQSASAQLRDASGNAVGTVIFSTQGNKVLVVANLNGLMPGFHGFHVHTTGSCNDTADGRFMAAGGHLNPSGASHPDHAGDLPPLLVNSDGTAFLSVETDRFTLNELLAGDGSAVMIHTGADNFSNIPGRYANTGVESSGLVTATPMGTPSMDTTPGALMGDSLADDETLRAGDSGLPFACGVIEEIAFAATATTTVTATVTETELPASTVEATAEATMPVEGTPTLTGSETPVGTTTPEGTAEPTLEVTLTVEGTG